MSEQDRIVRAASDKEEWTVHGGERAGPDLACSQSQNCTCWAYHWAALWGSGTDNGAPLWEPQMSHEWQSSQKRPCPASAGTLFVIAAEFGRQRYSRVPNSVLVSPAARRLVHGVTWSQNSATFHVYFLRHHITVNRTIGAISCSWYINVQCLSVILLH